MGLHRALAHHELRGNLRIREAAGEVRQYLSLARSELLDPGQELSTRGATPELVDDRLRHAWVDDRPASSDFVNRRQDLFGRRLLQDERACTRPEGADDVLVQPEGR